MSAPASLEVRCANTVRALSIDAIQRANSGHPGAPMGMADMATVLWGRVLRFDPSAPDWADRDRVVLSNGHASAMLYSMLFLTDSGVALDELRSFRQWGSRTAGHPEHGVLPGVETTTGPLGQGLATAVGMALAESWMRAQFGQALVDHYTYVFAGDGCMMEGLSSEAGSLAGHLGLGRLIVLYDDNRITIDGSTGLAFTEDVGRRFQAFGWQVIDADGHDQASIHQALLDAKADTERPSLVRCRTTIGWGSPKLAGSEKCHGSPLGAEEVAATKRQLGLDPNLSFDTPADVVGWFRRRNAQLHEEHLAWQGRLQGHADRERWERFHDRVDLSGVQWPEFQAGSRLATRKAGHQVLQALAAHLDNFVGGSADLAGSNGVALAGLPDVSREQPGGRNLHFGIREHAMAALTAGMALHGGVIPFSATFMVFHDYMRPAVRLAALMELPLVYVYTHDSVHVGEDGPTHQPVEQLQAMRAMPGLNVVRPADAAETAVAWRMALERRDGPTAICLTRQGLPVYDRGVLAPADGLLKGGYVLAEAEGGGPEVVLIGTGSEVELAMEARELLQEEGVATRVVSLPCWEVFLAQGQGYRDRVLPVGVPRVSVEAGVTFGWERIVGSCGASVGIDRFGASAPGPRVALELGLTAENVVATVRRVLES